MWEKIDGCVITGNLCIVYIVIRAKSFTFRKPPVDLTALLLPILTP